MSLKTLYVDICSNSDSDCEMTNSGPDEHEDPLVREVIRSKKRYKSVVQSSPINKPGRPSLAQSRKFYRPKCLVALSLGNEAKYVKAKPATIQSTLRRGPRHAFNTLRNENNKLKPNIDGKTKVYDTMIVIKKDNLHEMESNTYGKDTNSSSQPMKSDVGTDIVEHSLPYIEDIQSDRCCTPERSSTPLDLECLYSHRITNELNVAIGKKPGQLTPSNFKHEKKSENYLKSSNLARQGSSELFHCNRIKCNFTAQTKKELAEHKKMVHNYNKEYCRDKRSYIAMGPTELKTHFLRHSDELTLSSDYEDCEYPSKQKQNLVYNKKMHSTRKHRKCEFRDCDYKTLFVSNLKYHMMKKHGAAKTIACKLCSYRCHFEHELRRHLLCHSNDRPYQCDYDGCNYACKISYSLTKHKRMHTQEKPYACDQCAFRSNFVNSLKAHKRTHTNERPFCCDHCGYRCNSSSNLKQHVLRKHPGGLDTEINPELFMKCRLCVEEKGKFHIKPLLKDQIKECFDIEVDPFDCYSKLICEKCKIAVENFHFMRKSYQEKQTSLISNNTKEKVDDSNHIAQQQNIVSSSQLDVRVEVEDASPVITKKSKRKKKLRKRAVSTSDSDEKCDNSIENSHIRNCGIKKKATKDFSDDDWRQYYIQRFVCRYCGKKVKTKSALIRHFTKHEDLRTTTSLLIDKHCVISLDKWDERPNFTGENNVLVYNNNKILGFQDDPEFYISYEPPENYQHEANTTFGRKKYSISDLESDDDSLGVTKIRKIIRLETSKELQSKGLVMISKRKSEISESSDVDNSEETALDTESITVDSSRDSFERLSKKTSNSKQGNNLMRKIDTIVSACYSKYNNNIFEGKVSENVELDSKVLNRKPMVKYKPYNDLMQHKDDTQVNRVPQNSTTGINIADIDSIRIILHSETFPNQVTHSPLKYLQDLLQVHKLNLIDSSLIQSNLHILIKFKLGLFQPIMKTLNLWIKLLGRGNDFLIELTTEDEKSVDAHKMSATWQWEVLKAFHNLQVVKKVLNNAEKVGKEYRNIVNEFCVLINSIKLKYVESIQKHAP